MDRNVIEYLPEFLREFKEIKTIAEKQQEQAENLWNSLETIWNNNFIETLDEDGCSRWEAILSIYNKSTYTIEERRNRIASKMAEQRPFTLKSLKKILCAFSNKCTIELMDYVLSIIIPLSDKKMISEIEKLLDRVLPANIKFNLILDYNTYNILTGCTYGQLEELTYEQIRSEVLS